MGREDRFIRLLLSLQVHKINKMRKGRNLRRERKIILMCRIRHFSVRFNLASLVKILNILLALLKACQ